MTGQLGFLFQFLALLYVHVFKTTLHINYQDCFLSPKKICKLSQLVRTDTTSACPLICIGGGGV